VFLCQTADWLFGKVNFVTHDTGCITLSERDMSDPEFLRKYDMMRNPRGYITIRILGKPIPLHALFFIHRFRRYPREGCQLGHLCQIPCCLIHVREVSCAENLVQVSCRWLYCGGRFILVCPCNPACFPPISSCIIGRHLPFGSNFDEITYDDDDVSSFEQMREEIIPFLNLPSPAIPSPIIPSFCLACYFCGLMVDHPKDLGNHYGRHRTSRFWANQLSDPHSSAWTMAFERYLVYDLNAVEELQIEVEGQVKAEKRQHHAELTRQWYHSNKERILATRRLQYQQRKLESQQTKLVKSIVNVEESTVEETTVEEASVEEASVEESSEKTPTLVEETPIDILISLLSDTSEVTPSNSSESSSSNSGSSSSNYTGASSSSTDD
jgi:hypothetical protein